jgi:hypothetical protein
MAAHHVAVLQDHVPYDDTKYVASLKRTNTELYARVTASQSAPTGAQLCEK